MLTQRLLYPDHAQWGPQVEAAAKMALHHVHLSDVERWDARHVAMIHLYHQACEARDRAAAHVGGPPLEGPTQVPDPMLAQDQPPTRTKPYASQQGPRERTLPPKGQAGRHISSFAIGATNSGEGVGSGVSTTAENNLGGNVADDVGKPVSDDTSNDISIVPAELLELSWGLYMEQVAEVAARREASPTLRALAAVIREHVRSTGAAGGPLAPVQVRSNFHLKESGMFADIVVYPKGGRGIGGNGEAGRKLAIRVMQRDMYCRNDFAEVGESRALSR